MTSSIALLTSGLAIAIAMDSAVSGTRASEGCGAKVAVRLPSYGARSMWEELAGWLGPRSRAFRWWWGAGFSLACRGRTALWRGGPGGCPLAGYGNQVAASGHPPGPPGHRPGHPGCHRLRARSAPKPRGARVGAGPLGSCPDVPGGAARGVAGVDVAGEFSKAGGRFAQGHDRDRVVAV